MDSRILFGTVLSGIVIFAIVLSFLATTPKGECKETTHILKGVNGITDQNDGLFSGGDVEQTSLLMDTGRILTVGYRIDNLYLGKPIIIKECISLIGTEILNINQ